MRCLASLDAKGSYAGKSGIIRRQFRFNAKCTCKAKEENAKRPLDRQINVRHHTQTAVLYSSSLNILFLGLRGCFLGDMALSVGPGRGFMFYQSLIKKKNRINQRRNR